MESKSLDNTHQNCSSGKDTMKQKVKTESTVSKQDSDIQGTTELLNPSVLDEVLAEKKLALMRSPEVMKFLQSQQAELAKQQKDTNKDDED
ncbi:regulatory factor X-associated protein-like [Mytilus californianus]|uniref:regulatory factor X-associated protein-like n=1 Tax=Mytilus californianus TaxID=6549 RepID=UPI002245A052|nr:regulatory factor X-associated protein-like [Mytilus californianus]